MPLRRLVQLFSCALAACPLLVSGCNIVAPAIYFIRGPDKIKKVHALDKTKTTVVFIDDRANRVPRRALRVLMGETAEKTLLSERIVKDMISCQSVLAAAGSDREGKPLSVAEIGEAVKAERVIYATVDQFYLTPDGSSVAPTLAMRVRVIDVKADKRLWPDDPNGYRLVTAIKAKTATVPSSVTGTYQLEDDLARRAGVDLAQLFYDHARPPSTRVTE